MSQAHLLIIHIKAHKGPDIRERDHADVNNILNNLQVEGVLSFTQLAVFLDRWQEMKDIFRLFLM